MVIPTYIGFLHPKIQCRNVSVFCAAVYLTLSLIPTHHWARFRKRLQRELNPGLLLPFTVMFLPTLKNIYNVGEHVYEFKVTSTFLLCSNEFEKVTHTPDIPTHWQKKIKRETRHNTTQ